jgi:SnoaL-like domain
MAMQLRCRCGANLSADPDTSSIVCGACGATVAVPQPERELGLSETVPALPQQRVPTPPPVAPKHRSSAPIAIGALAVVAVGIVLVIIATRGDDRVVKADPPSTKPAIDAAPVEEPPKTATSPEELVVLERAAIARADEAALRALLAPNVFVHGPDTNDMAYDAATAAPLVRSLGGAIVESAWSKITLDKNVAWIVDDLEVGGVKLLASQLAFRDGGTWRIAAWHFAKLVPNKRAYELAKERNLLAPQPLEEHTDDDRQVHTAFTTAFASRDAFILAFSERADAIDLGSAPGERIVGGRAVKRAFTSIAADFEIIGPVAAGRIDDRVGWAAGNVGFSMQIAGEPIQQIFRVLAVFVREQAGWKIVLAQWSNPGPIR